MSTGPEREISAITAPTDTTPAEDGMPLAMSHAAMNAAYNTGEVTLLAASMAWITRYRGAWWVACERGWLRVADAVLAEDLDKAATRLAEAQPCR
jgi:hypothetical protein